MLEVGKYYKHSTGTLVAIRAKANTTIWNEVFIAESPSDIVGLIPMDIEQDMKDWTEVSEKEWKEAF